VDTHTHSFAPSEWPFADPINTLVITTKHVLNDGHPILLVTHDDDGDWQVLCGTTNDPADGLVVCLGCAYERDTSIGQLSDLPRGWSAWRDSPRDPWRREPSPSDEET
jgi:hypothetical protein